MAQFSATDAALEGFRLIRQRPQLLPVWAAVQLSLAVLTGLLGVALGGEALTEFTRGAFNRLRPEEQMARMGELVPFLLASGLVNLLGTAVLSAAVFRAVLRPNEGGPGHLRLGGDELRVLVAYLGVFALMFVVTLGLVLGLTLIVEAGSGVRVLLGIATVLIALAPFVAFLVGYVRLMLSLPQSFAERRVSVVGGWVLSRRRFWPLLGMLVLAAALSLLVVLLAQTIYFPLGALVGGGLKAAGAPLRPDYSSLADWFSPATGVYLLVMALAGAMVTAALVAPLARAYRDLSSAAPTA